MGVVSSRSGLRRELGVAATLALSLSSMGPTLGVSLSGATPAGLVGKSVPLMFVLAAVGVALVGYGLIRMSRHISHAGSMYGLTGATLGPRAGFLAGWALFASYLSFVVLVVAAVGVFGEIFLQQLGVPAGLQNSIALGTGLLAWALAALDVRKLMRSFLVLEAVGVLAVLVTTVAIYVKLGGHMSPTHSELTWSVFSWPAGAGGSSIGLAIVFGFLSFAGFEASLSLGEEARNPRRTIPLALGGVIFFGAIYYVVVFGAQTLGFGTDDAGLNAFATSGSPMADLAQSYVGKGMSELLNLAFALSAFVTAIGLTAAGGRLLFAFARDGLGPRQLANTSSRTGAPTKAISVVAVLALVYTWAMRAAGTSMLDVFEWSATIGTLAIIVAYAMTTIGAAVFLGRRAVGARKLEAVIPAIGTLFLGYVLWKNLFPAPAEPFKWFPYVVGGWLLLGLLIVVLTPGLARRIGLGLAKDLRPDTEETGEAVPVPAGAAVPAERVSE